jgi:hypothetical protein
MVQSRTSLQNQPARVEIRLMFEAMQRRVLCCLCRIAFGTMAGIGVLWLILAQPFHSCGGRLNTNESAAIATLKNIHSGQCRFRDEAAIDRDHDGHGEFAWFRELASTTPLRGDRTLAYPCLSQRFATVTDGRVLHAGYLFQLWLPARGGGWTTEDAGTEVDSKAAETQFRCLAWPLAGKGKRAFFLDASGDLFACSNRDYRYQGGERPIPVEAAVPSREHLFGSMINEAAGPGDWVPVQ